MRNQTVIMDPVTGGCAYPRCKSCARLSVRERTVA
jgi:hypothetical protein